MSGKVSVDISMSLDGFIAGPNDRPEQGLGEGGERLHEWLYDLSSFRQIHGSEGGQQTRDSEVLEEAVRNLGAVVMGRRMFDLAEEAWGPNPPFHGPVYVATHRPRQPLQKEGGTTFTFVTDGAERALELARSAAGDRDVSVAGGADVIRQLLRPGLIDELQIHLIPVILGGGTSLFGGLGPEHIELEIQRVIDSPAVSHVKYRVRR